MKTIKIFSVCAFVCLIASLTTSQLFAKAPKVNSKRKLAAGDCHSWSLREWDAYIRENAQLNNGRYLYDQLDLAQKMCPESFKRPEIQKCTDRTLHFYPQFIWDANEKKFLSGGEIQSTIHTDAGLYQMQPAERMKLPEVLANAKYGLPENWREIAKVNNWKWVYFTSRFSHERRIAMIIPYKEYTQYLLYFFTKNFSGDDELRGIQTIIVEFRRDGEKLVKPSMYFRSFDFDENQNVQVTNWNERCVSCHSNGPRKILPDTPDDFAGATVPEYSENTTSNDLNKLIVMKEIPDLSFYYNLTAMPTHLEIESPITSEVGDTCSSCHNGKKRQSLSFLIKEDGTISYLNLLLKVRGDPEDSLMPLNPTVDYTREQRKQMVKDLVASFDPQLVRWLTEIKCEK